MANLAQSRHLDELINDINFPLPEGDMLDLDFDFESSDFLDEALGLQDTPMESLLDQQYGAVAALATQGAIVRPVLTATDPGTQQTYEQDWHRWDPNNPFPADGSSAPRAAAMPSSLFAPPQQNASEAPSAQPDLTRFDFQGMPSFLSAPPQAPTSTSGNQQESLHQVQQQSAPDLANARIASMGSHDSASSRGSGEHGSGELAPQHQEKTEAELRAERTKQKNKRAQKKFRQKQKDKHEELERSAAELAARLKRTLGELDALQNQKKVLEIALTRNSNPAPSSSVASNSQETEEEPVFVPAKGFERFSSKSGILLEVLFDPPRKLSHEQAIRLSLKDHARIWKEVCRQASELLRAGDKDINSPSGRKLRALLNERHGLLAWTSVNNPVIMHKLMTSKLVDPPIPDNESPGPEFWNRILEAMRLSDEQKTNLLKARNTYLTEVGRLLEERRRLQTILRGLDTGFKSALGDKARTHVLWAEAVRALQENVDAFHICHCVFMVTVFNRATGFSVFQEARLLVQSFPHAPDVFALLKELAAIAGEPTAPALLKEGAAKSPPPALPNRAVDAEQEPYISLEHKMESAIAAVKLDNFIEKLH